jgi:4-hydroxybenzoyl-CoA thioesterase
MTLSQRADAFMGEIARTMSPTLQLTVAWGDCDALGIIFYPNYFRWMDTAFHALLQQAGLSHRSLLKTFGAAVPIVQANAEFRAPATYGNVIDIAATVGHWGRKSFRVDYRGTRDGASIFDGFEARVWAKAGDGIELKTVEIASEFKGMLEAQSNAVSSLERICAPS